MPSRSRTSRAAKCWGGSRSPDPDRWPGSLSTCRCTERSSIKPAAWFPCRPTSRWLTPSSCFLRIRSPRIARSVTSQPTSSAASCASTDNGCDRANRSNKVQSPKRENSAMAREDRLLETFVTLADTLIDQYDIIDFLQTLAECCVDLVHVSAAGIMLADPQGNLRHAACSNEQMRFVELMELQLGEGPCFDAYRTNTPVICESPEEAARRWPEFAPRAKAGGFGAFSAVPMRLRSEVIGA